MEIAQQRAQLTEALERLTNAAGILRQSLMGDKARGWAARWYEVSNPCLIGASNGIVEDAEAYDLTARIYTQFLYAPIQAPTQTVMAVGYVMASEQTIEAAQALNREKKAFETLVVSFGERPGMKNVARRNKKIKQLLALGGDQALCLKQAYRQIQVLPKPVAKLKWSWESKPATRKITRDKSIAQLLELKNFWVGHEGLYEPQLRALASLPAGAELVQVLQEKSTGLKVRTGQLTASGKSYAKLSASMPVILCHQSPPPFTPPSPTPEFKNWTGGTETLRSNLIAPSINVWTKSTL
ncbi:MAG: DNA replication terminus site-binding protein [Exilibacterium sp.]